MNMADSWTMTAKLYDGGREVSRAETERLEAEIARLRAFVQRVAALPLWIDRYPDATTPPRMHHDLPDEWVSEARTLLAHPR
jgi:hypothetical protein